MVMVDWYSNDFGCRPGVYCSRCGTGQEGKVLRDGLFFCSDKARCDRILLYGEEK
jgi:hypothetical protein